MHSRQVAGRGGPRSRSILYDNTRLAVARILGDGRRERSRTFAELQSHYLFMDRFERPGKGNDKGKGGGLVGYARRNFLLPVPVVASFAELNAHLERRCLERLDHRLRGHAETIGARLERDLTALQPRPPSPYDACDRRATRVSALSLVRYERNDYSVPTAYDAPAAGLWQTGRCPSASCGPQRWRQGQCQQRGQKIAPPPAGAAVGNARKHVPQVQIIGGYEDGAPNIGRTTNTEFLKYRVQ